MGTILFRYHTMFLTSSSRFRPHIQPTTGGCEGGKEYRLKVSKVTMKLSLEISMKIPCFFPNLIPWKLPVEKISNYEISSKNKTQFLHLAAFLKLSETF